MVGLKGFRRVQTGIESARRQFSAKPASNVLTFHSAGIRIGRTIIKKLFKGIFLSTGLFINI